MHRDSKVSMYIQMEKTVFTIELLKSVFFDTFPRFRRCILGHNCTRQKSAELQASNCALSTKHTSKIALAFTVNKKPWHFSNKNNQSVSQELIRNLGCLMSNIKMSVLAFWASLFGDFSKCTTSVFTLVCLP